MKRFIAYICSLMLVFTATTLSAAISKDDIKTTPITIRDGIGDAGQITRPRTPAFVPINGLYDDGRVILDFIDEIGHISVTVANQSTGETYFEYCDSAEGHFEMEITPSKGDYLLTIQTENGAIYYGNFTL